MDNRPTHPITWVMKKKTLTKIMCNVLVRLHTSLYFLVHILYGYFYQKAFYTLSNLTVDGCRPYGSERFSIGINDVARVEWGTNFNTADE
jgi:hypothetical protein